MFVTFHQLCALGSVGVFLPHQCQITVEEHKMQNIAVMNIIALTTLKLITIDVQSCYHFGFIIRVMSLFLPHNYLQLSRYGVKYKAFFLKNTTISSLINIIY